MSYLDQLAGLYTTKGLPFEIHNDTFWQVYNRMVEPRGPASKPIVLDKKEAASLRKSLGGLLIRWTGAFENRAAKETDWFALICDQHIPVAQVQNKSQKKKLKKALSVSEFRPVSANFIAQNAYPVYVKAHQRYGNNKNNFIAQKAFQKQALIDADFEQLIQYFGVFHGGQLAAYSKCYSFDNEEVNYTQSKFDPDFLKYRIGEVMAYGRNEFYLEKQQVKYVNSGWRSIEHQTNIQDFYQQKFQFKKMALPLYIQYEPKVDMALRLLRPFGNSVGRFSPKLGALIRLDGYRKK